MKSAWDKIFNTDAADPLTEEEREAALQELAKAVSEVDRVRSTPEHERIRKQIEAIMAHRQEA